MDFNNILLGSTFPGVLVAPHLETRERSLKSQGRAVRTSGKDISARAPGDRPRGRVLGEPPQIIRADSMHVCLAFRVTPALAVYW
jgi:hypothetical protein